MARVTSGICLFVFFLKSRHAFREDGNTSFRHSFFVLFTGEMS